MTQRHCFRFIFILAFMRRSHFRLYLPARRKVCFPVFHDKSRRVVNRIGLVKGVTEPPTKNSQGSQKHSAPRRHFPIPAQDKTLHLRHSEPAAITRDQVSATRSKCARDPRPRAAANASAGGIRGEEPESDRSSDSPGTRMKDARCRAADGQH